MLKKKSIYFLPALLALSLLMVYPSFASNVTEGCTPGYWKNHTDVWFTFKPTDTLEYAFSTNLYAGGPIWGNEPEPEWWFNIKNQTLIEALKFHGGSGIDGAMRIYFRQAVAALLNGTAWDQIYSLGYPVINFHAGGYVIWHVRFQLKNCETREEFLAFAADWDRLNNLGCPLNRYGLRK